MRLKHYYHLYAAGQWLEPLNEHLDALRDSGLDQEMGEMQVGIVGPPHTRVGAIRHLTDSGIPFSVCAEANTGWEQVTMDVMYDDCMQSEEPFFCLYAHTKGAQYGPPLYPDGVQRPWRRTMTKWNVTEWRQAVHHMSEGAAGCGCLWQSANVDNYAALWMYAGNFFWFNSKFVKEHDDVLRPMHNSRYDAEVWVGQLAKHGDMKVTWASPIEKDPLMAWNDGT